MMAMGENQKVAIGIRIRKVVLRGSSLWLAIDTHDWLALLELATTFGWELPEISRPKEVEGSPAIVIDDLQAQELVDALCRAYRTLTDRDLAERFFRRRGWKKRITSITEFFRMGGVAILVMVEGK
jgi:hypothetical protein